MKDCHKLSTLNARFSAPSSKNPGQLPSEMQKGFRADDLTVPRDLAIIVQVVNLVNEAAANAQVVEVPTCQCEGFCFHRKVAIQHSLALLREAIAQRSDSLTKLRAAAELRKREALLTALRTTQNQWIVRARARHCAKICETRKVIRPLEILTGPNDKIRCVKIAHNRPYCLLRLLGRGGFSSVWEVYDREASRRLAAKLTMMPSSGNTEGRDAARWLLECLTREVMLLKNDRTPTLLGMHDCFNWNLEGSGKGVATIHDLCDCDLAVWMKRIPLKDRPMALMKQWVRDILEALDHLHTRRGVLHTDLKPENVLKGICDEAECHCSDSRCKVADFGLHKVLLGNKSCPVDMSDELNWNGTVIYQAPEHLKALTDKDTKYEMTDKIDVWSVGVISLELFQDVMPFRPKAFKRDIRDIASRVLSTQCEFMLKAEDSLEEQFLGRMLEIDPKKRASAQELIEHAFLQSTQPCAQACVEQRDVK